MSIPAKKQAFHGFPAGAPVRGPEWSQSSRCCGPGSRYGRPGRDRRQRRHLAHGNTLDLGGILLIMVKYSG